MKEVKTYDDVVELASAIEYKIIKEVCSEDTNNMQFVIPYDENCRIDGLETSPANSFNLCDAIRDALLEKLNIKDIHQE